MLQWIIDHKEMLFSGIGVFALSLIIGFFTKKDALKQKQRSGSNSTNYQAGGDIHIGSKNDK